MNLDVSSEITIRWPGNEVAAYVFPGLLCRSWQGRSEAPMGKIDKESLMTEIEYSLEPRLQVEELVDVLRRSTLAEAETYYPHIGMERHNSCWRIERQRDNS